MPHSITLAESGPPPIMKVLNARVPDEMRAALNAEAERRGLPVSVAIREAIGAWLATADTEAGR